MLDRRFGGKNFDVREVLESRCGGKVVISMAVGNVYGAEFLAGTEDAFDPGRDLVALLDGQGGSMRIASLSPEMRVAAT